MDEHFDRLERDIRHPFTRHAESRGRLGWKDIPHAITNLFVEYARYDPYAAGHAWLYLWLVTVGLAGVVITGAVVLL